MILIPLFCLSQVKDDNMTLLQKTFGYLQSQEFMLASIENKYPELSLEASIANREFHKSFSKAISQINITMIGIYGSSFENYLQKLKKSATNSFENISRENAVIFINQVKKRAKGIIKPPYLEVLLAYQYKDNPIGELENNHYRVYSVLNYFNSNKTELNFHIPTSWRELSTKKYPGVLKKFRSEYGYGNEIITIAKRLLSDEKSGNRQTIEKEVQEIVPKDAEQIRIVTETIDEQRFYKVQYFQINDKITNKLKRYVTVFILERNNYLVLMNCSIYRSTNDITSKRKFEPLFQSIFGSIDIEHISLSKTPSLVHTNKQ